MTPEQIANFVANAMKCMTCGEVFHGTSDPHTDDDCPLRYASWETPTRDEIAKALLEAMKQ